MRELTLFQLQVFTYSIIRKEKQLSKHNNLFKLAIQRSQINQTSKIKCTKLTNFFETVMHRIISRNRQSNSNSFISNSFQRFELIEIISCFCKGIHREKLQKIEKPCGNLREKRLFFVNIVQNKFCFAKVGELFIGFS